MEIVQVTSKEIIKPSSPTPSHLEYFKISIFDHLFPVFYQPFLFFYRSNPNLSIEEKLGRLKELISKTQAQFYPLGGQIKDSITIDEGVLFVVAKVGCGMIDCLKPVNIELLSKFIQLSPIFKESPEKEVPIGIQVNIFTCGGIAIGISFLHKFIDGTTFNSFFQAWGAITRENFNQEWCPHSVAASLFPLFPPEQFSAQMPFFEEITPRPEQKKIAKWFVFDDAVVSSLKAKARSENVHNPTSVEAISGLIWKCLIRSDSQESTTFVHLVNLWPRLSPPPTEFSIGAILWRAIATSDPRNEKKKELPCLVDLLRKSIVEVNAEYLSYLQLGEGEKICKLLEEGREIYDRSKKTYVVSNITKMEFYEEDFGCGKPLWFTVAPMVQEVQINMIYQIHIGSSNGIEVLAILDDHDMEKLERNSEFRTYATLKNDILSRL